MLLYVQLSLNKTERTKRILMDLAVAFFLCVKQYYCRTTQAVKDISCRKKTKVLSVATRQTF